MKLTINLQPHHIVKCRKFASFNRTLTRAIELLANASNETDDTDTHDDILSNIDELAEIQLTIEALQFAIREAKIDSIESTSSA